MFGASSSWPLGDDGLTPKVIVSNTIPCITAGPYAALHASEQNQIQNTHAHLAATSRQNCATTRTNPTSAPIWACCLDSGMRLSWNHGAAVAFECHSYFSATAANRGANSASTTKFVCEHGLHSLQRKTSTTLRMAVFARCSIRCFSFANSNDSATSFVFASLTKASNLGKSMLDAPSCLTQDRPHRSLVSSAVSCGGCRFNSKSPSPTKWP